MNASAISKEEAEKWLSIFPRLFDLYQRSEKSNPKNYFNFEELFPIAFLGSAAFADIENALAKLDVVSWEKLCKKALPFVTADDPQRRFHQLFNVLNEARGYAYLAEQNYEQIDFLEDRSEKSPDLSANKGNSVAILEVKTVNQSDEDIYEEIHRHEAMRVRPKLSDKFQTRILRSIKDAREQLDAYPNPTNRKIVFLTIHMESSQRTCGESYINLKDFIASQNTSDVEIIHLPTL